ncbi:MAG: Rieske 2Fe-2S domain-containing protein [Verrucomicrobia bacterium]|nr:Rieske 2Fe-2S domain-containing protein [Verrucomicrobiota bacterium]MBI3868264.1 Rieske 2Fe-2S domain-containing protein [Verrucomicrobiota bacterium]
MPAVRIVGSDQLQERSAFKFQFMREGLRIEAFVTRFQGRVVAFENLCRHIPITIDYDDNRFYAPDDRHIVCQTHGALYEPLTGKCVRGPCEGASLHALRVEEREGAVWLLNVDRIQTQAKESAED